MNKVGLWLVATLISISGAVFGQGARQRGGKRIGFAVQTKRLSKVLEAAEANPGISVEKAAGDYLPAEKKLSEARNTMPDKA